MSSPKSHAAQWAGISAAAAISVFLGVFLGVASQALLPVKTFTGSLPPLNAKKNDLPKVYWLKAFVSRDAGNYRQKEKQILAGQAARMSDREINSWMNRTFAGDELKEDLDARLGTPFVRAGGQGRDNAKDPVLNVTMPFNLKIGPLPSAEVPLRFVATPTYDGGNTDWIISDVTLGHARVPPGMTRNVVIKAIEGFVESKPDAKKLWEALGKYRRVTIRDGQVSLDSSIR